MVHCISNAAIRSLRSGSTKNHSMTGTEKKNKKQERNHKPRNALYTSTDGTPN